MLFQVISTARGIQVQLALVGISTMCFGQHATDTMKQL